MSNDDEINAGIDGIDDEIDAEFDAELAMLLAAPELWAEPAGDLGDRIVASIAAERDAAATLPTAPVVRLDAARERSARRRRWLPTAGAALIGAAAAAVVTVAVVPRDDAPGTAEPPPVEAVIVLAGTDLAPGISGTAEVRTEQSGVWIQIQAPGLPRREGDEFYEGWLRSCDGTRLVPIGTFHELDDASGWAGVAIADHPLLTVTTETVAGPKDPLQGSSGEVVVSGALAPCPEG